MIDPSSLPFLPVTTLRTLISSSEVTSIELLDAFLARVKVLNPSLNAIIILDEKAARERARFADIATKQNVSWGRLHGIPFTVKENCHVASMDCTIGDPLLVQKPSATSEPVVARLIEAGAIIFGKTNLPEAAADWQSYNLVYGSTNNPFNLELTPGGSSGGSASALAACLTPFEIGGDIGGSIRIPASFCSLFGHKPTYQILAKPGSPGNQLDLSVRGPLARCANDLKLLMEVCTTLNGPAKGFIPVLAPSTKTDITEFRVALIESDPVCPVNEETRTLVKSVARRLRKLRCAVITENIELPFDSEMMMKVYLKLLSATLFGDLDESSTMMEKLKVDAGKYSDNDESIDATAARAPFQTLFQYRKANSQRHEFRTRWEKFFENYDVLIAPIFATPAFQHDCTPADHPFWRPSARTLCVDGVDTPYHHHVFWSALTTTCYLPSTAFPAGIGSESGLPIGLQIVCREGADLMAIQFAACLEEQGYKCVSPPAPYGCA